MVVEVEAVLGRVLPWVGGFTGATLLYFLAVIWLNWRQESRLRRIEVSIAELRGMLSVMIGMKRRGGRS